MIGRRAILGLWLLSISLFCAFEAQGALAAASGTTAFTCVEVGAGKGDFKDAHCDENVGANNGSFAHKALTETPTSEVEITNAETKNVTKESTNAIFKGEVALTSTEITCTSVRAVGTITNGLEGENHTVTFDNGKGEPDLIMYAGCTVQKPLNCTISDSVTKVTGNIDMSVIGISSATLGSSKTEMGVSFAPAAGKVLSSITYSGASCGLAKQTFVFEGSLVATGITGGGACVVPPHSGATLTFTEAMTKGPLQLGGKAASLSSSVTLKMKGGNPISLTTPPFTEIP
jgi:hypothetical protein